MSASVTQLLILTQFQVTENPGSAPSGVGVSSFFGELDQLQRLTSTSTPPVSLFGVYKTTLSGGYSIDFSSLQGSSGTLNATTGSKKLVAIIIANPSASSGDVNVATGASNGYTIPQPLKVKPGGFVIEYFAGALTGSDATHKTLDVSGTNGDTPEIALVFG